MDTGSLADAALPTCMPEERAMRDGRLIRDDTGVSFIRIPSEKNVSEHWNSIAYYSRLTCLNENRDE